MTDMEKLDQNLAAMIRSYTQEAEKLNAQAKAAIEAANRATAAVRNFRVDTTQIDAAVANINSVTSKS